MTNVVQPNPLTAFFRKSRFKITLPSEGKWYPEGCFQLNPDNSLDVYPMNAADDIKFRAGEITQSGRTTYDLIQSCLPGVLKPEEVLTIDFDAILMAIRYASYGNTLETTVTIPKTTIKKKVSLEITELLSRLPAANEWDENLTIENETGLKLALVIHPVNLKRLFSTTKTILNQRRVISGFDNNSELTDEAQGTIDKSVSDLTQAGIDVVCSSVVSAQLNSESPVTDSNFIRELVTSLDVTFFQAIQNHIETQRSKFALKTPVQTSTPNEIASGVGETWQAEIRFDNTEFFQAK